MCLCANRDAFWTLEDDVGVYGPCPRSTRYVLQFYFYSNVRRITSTHIHKLIFQSPQNDITHSHVDCIRG